MVEFKILLLCQFFIGLKKFTTLYIQKQNRNVTNLQYLLLCTFPGYLFEVQLSQNDVLNIHHREILKQFR